ncbi:MAG: hypothetical protein AAGI23_21420 [Bacteroidota bacterium]
MLHQVNLLFHVIAAVSAIIVGVIAYAARKGGKGHAISGRLFLLFMGIVIITALNGVLFFVDRPFLTVVTFQSFYLSYSGYRVLKVRRTGMKWFDVGVILSVLGVIISLAQYDFQWLNCGTILR